jgi:HAMP domain-containing protein
MALAESRRREEAILLLNERAAVKRARASEALRAWFGHTRGLATFAGDEAVTGLEAARRRFLQALILALAVAGGLGLLTFRRILGPTPALQESVESIASGDYATSVPFADGRDDGSLARSIEER